MTLLKSNLLPYAKLSRVGNKIIIYKAVLGELYRLGVKERQLPDLMALSNFMKGDYRKYHGIMGILCTEKLLQNYFDNLDVFGRKEKQTKLGDQNVPK